MTTGTPTKSRLEQIRRTEEKARQAAESILLEARSRGETTLSAGEAQRYAQAQQDWEEVCEHRRNYEEDLARVGENKLERLSSSVQSADAYGRMWARETVETLAATWAAMSAARSCPAASTCRR
jgi:hypothetical protein